MFKGLNFDIYAFVHFFKAEIYRIFQNSDPKNGANGFLEFLDPLQLVSHKI